jgi:hypothetical protein
MPVKDDRTRRFELVNMHVKSAALSAMVEWHQTPKNDAGADWCEACGMVWPCDDISFIAKQCRLQVWDLNLSSGTHVEQPRPVAKKGQRPTYEPVGNLTNCAEAIYETD